MVTVNNARRGKLRLAHGVILCPGDNVVDDDLWHRCQDHPITRHYTDRRELTVSPGPSASIEVPDPDLSTEASSAPGDTTREPTLPFVEPIAAEPCEACLPGTDSVAVASLRARDAIALVQSSDDVLKLRAMLASDSRATVVRAIERRIADLKG